jgi:transposase-like protein
MKKLVVLLNLACVSPNVFGTYATWLQDKFGKNFVHRPIERDSETASSSSSISIRDSSETASTSSLFQKDSIKSPHINNLEKSADFELSKIDPAIRKKIRNFAQNFKSPIYSAQQIEKALNEYASHPNDSIQAIAARNKLPLSTLYWWKSNAGFSLRRLGVMKDQSRKRIDPEIRKKIQDFSQTLKSHIYKTQQIEKALIEYVSLCDHSIENIAKTNKIPVRTFSGWISKLELSSRREDRHKKARKSEQKLINSLNRGVKWKNLHKVIEKKRNSTINTLRKLHDRGQIGIELTEEKKNKIIKDYREKILTNKGIARKYNITESDVYCVIHEARQRKKDLSIIKMKWKISNNKSSLITENQKEKMVRDYNKGLLTLQGICVKHEITMKIAQSVLYRENGERLKRRNGRLKKMEELVSDITSKSNRKIEKKYGYKPVYIDELKRYAQQWTLLSDNQKNLFKYTMHRGVMPTAEIISSIKKSPICAVNEKFKKMLFVLGATYEDIMAEYSITRKSANKLKRESEFWKIMSKQKTS